ncbi:MAG: hypothetical protein ACR2HM_09660 [Acidimicrobiales bacterium]
MRDVTAVAGGNHAAHLAAAEACHAADGSGRLRAFHELVAASPASTNASAGRLSAYDHAGGVVDTRSTHPDEGSFEASQGGALAGREGFEDLWDHGRRFVYGAVNAGGMGAEPFGDFCLVFRDCGEDATDALAVFPEDSVSRYADAVGAVDADRAAGEATSWDDRGLLAVAELGSDALAASDTDWPGVVCSGRDYLEVVMAGSFPPPTLSEIRVRSSVRGEAHHYWEQAQEGVRLSARARTVAAAYDVVLRWRDYQGCAITEVPEGRP